MQPIFILSLPRSGSTLLQKMLSAHSAVASVAEPWVLLPLADMSGEWGGRSYSRYSTRLATRAIEEFAQELPGGRERFREHLRVLMRAMYGDLCKSGESYFLDKTPRYYLIIDFIYQLFPEAKVVFLFRHPLDVLSSVVTTFSRGRFAAHHSHVDLFEGPFRLHEAHGRYGDNALTLHYEELVRSPAETCVRLTEYLGLAYEPAMVEGYQRIVFRGSMGDKVGDKKYKRPSTDSVSRWRDVLSPVVRKAFARRYVDTLGREVLSTFGTDLDLVRREIAELHGRWRGIVPDTYWLTVSWLARRSIYNILREQVFLRDIELHKLD